MTGAVDKNDAAIAFCRALLSFDGIDRICKVSETSRKLIFPDFKESLGEILGINWRDQWERLISLVKKEIGPNPSSGQKVLNCKITNDECPDLSDSNTLEDLFDELRNRMESD
jgi:hypothetical protein